ncbi:MAG: BatA domain-containing protein [Deltaproteobacteria bacterium]|nr:BatA domain-containing protein [Deltaproteobacteria bacterium]MBN2670728.1 BatA domain-containing protein [Deltaproteobacteria bacterium]
MSFASPWMLLGLLSLGPLIWLHVKRYQRQKVAFPTLFILQRVMQKQQKQFQVKHWVVLAVRILIVLMFVSALARPSLTVWRPGGVRSGLPLAQVILLDNSASMQQRVDDAQTAFERAKQMAVAEIGRLRPQDSVAIILVGKPPRLITDGLTTDKEPAALKIDTLLAGYAADAIDDSIVRAQQLLDKSSAAQKEILLITDLSAQPVLPETVKNVQSTLRILGVAPKTRVSSNVAVSRIDVRPSGENKAREVAIRATITNFGDTEKKLDVSLSLDNKPAAKGTLTVKPRQTAVKEFQHRFDDKGVHFGWVQIDDDEFTPDNIRYLATNVRRAIHVLVINGDSRPGSYLDEVFYLQKALETPMGGEVPIHTLVLEPEIAKVTPLEGYDVIFLAGVKRLSTGLGERLVAYVEDGGGLFISAAEGDSWTPLQPILPAQITGVRRSDKKTPYHMGAVALTHPIFQTLDEDSTGLEKTEVAGHLLLEPNPTVERKVLAQLDDGIPLLLERKVSEGTVLLLTTTIDRDWTDLPIRPGYLPLVQRATRYLSRSLAHREPRAIDVGTPVPLAVVEGMQKLIVSSPQKKRTVYAAHRLTNRTRIWFNGTTVPGSYRIWSEMPGFGGLSELPSSAFVANVAKTESDLSKKMKQSGEVSRDDKDMYTALKGKLPIWSHLLLAGMLLLLLEAALVGAGLRKSHLKRR